jgi:hypothetical protein
LGFIWPHGEDNRATLDQIALRDLPGVEVGRPRSRPAAAFGINLERMRRRHIVSYVSDNYSRVRHRGAGASDGQAGQQVTTTRRTGDIRVEDVTRPAMGRRFA